ncbi:type VI secretion system baseplate subunit TssE [uncultured Massilia sp.]|uniref:type VI secretion system baseplate subunit TssE n=1 Tax=uncultured Massilia sp. TaxID=169973 RepID=UPI0025E0FE71|nr:type VI secretion system baseplate subunit TssE [uncultured Massilia sp.]
MTPYLPGLFERLMGERAGEPAGRQSLEQLKDSIVRDLEALLNTRSGLAQDSLDAWPQARASVLDYGLADFAAFSLSGSEDRAAICAGIKEAIERHEPRLAGVSAVLEPEPGAVNRLRFVIHATLRSGDGAEPVDFDAVLQPSSLHYKVDRTGRPARS